MMTRVTRLPSESIDSDTVVRPWVRYALVALAVPNLATGVWAILSPQGWFDDFPGFGARLVAAEPPFNEHLATDAGAGLFAAGVVLLVAAWMATSSAVRLGLIGFGAFAVPHALWHTANPSDLLSGAENLMSTGSLLVSVGAAVVLWVLVTRDVRRQS